MAATANIGLTKQDLVEVGQRAGELARQDILQICESEGLTPQAIIHTILEGMEATTRKQQFVFGRDGGDGMWVEAPSLIDHGARMSAVKLGKDILGLDAPKRLDSTVHHDFMSPETADLVTRITSRGAVAITEATNITLTHARRITASFKDFAGDDVPIDIGDE